MEVSRPGGGGGGGGLGDLQRDVALVPELQETADNLSRVHRGRDAVQHGGQAGHGRDDGEHESLVGGVALPARALSAEETAGAQEPPR